ANPLQAETCGFSMQSTSMGQMDWPPSWAFSVSTRTVPPRPATARASQAGQSDSTTAPASGHPELSWRLAQALELAAGSLESGLESVYECARAFQVSRASPVFERSAELLHRARAERAGAALQRVSGLVESVRVILLHRRADAAEACWRVAHEQLDESFDRVWLAGNPERTQAEQDARVDFRELAARASLSVVRLASLPDRRLVRSPAT